MQATNSQTSIINLNAVKINLPVVFFSKSAKDTYSLGLEIAKLLKKGDIVAFRGALGSGKTVLAKGIGKGLGVKEDLTSPTYTIISEYEGFIKNSGADPDASAKKIPVYHIDAYRLEGDDDFHAIGGSDIIYGDGVSLIEWSERIPGFSSPETLRIDIEILDDEERKISVYKSSGDL